MDNTGRAHAEGSGCGSQGNRTPVFDQVGNIHATQACGQVITGGGGIPAFTLVSGSDGPGPTRNTIGRSRIAEPLVAATSHIAENPWLPGSEGVVDEVRLSCPTAGALVDQGLDGGHGRRGCGCSADSSDDDRATRVQVGTAAIAGLGTDRIETGIISSGREQGDIGKIADLIGGNTRTKLPCRLGISLGRTSGGVKRSPAGASAAGHDGLGGEGC